MHRSAAVATAVLSLACLVGCGPSFGRQARNGIVFYCPGAGNMDFGDFGVREGLKRAGFRGQVATFTWTIAPLNPAIDQTLRFNAKLRAKLLSGIIRDYIDEFPGRPVSLIGLSAGSGVALWALEGLPDGYQVDNVVFLGSSLHHRCDLAQGLRHVRGKLYNYFSPHDAILAGPMKVFGSIDGVFGEDGAGSIGFSGPSVTDRVINIAWRPEYQKYGNYGGHTDATSADFIHAIVSKNILSERGTSPPETARATPRARALRAAHRG